RAGVEERARKAETQRAAAEAEAREQRKRRKVQLALAAALVTILGLLAAGAWWNGRTEAAKLKAEGLVELRITEGRTASEAPLDQAEKALGESDAARAEAALAEAGRRIAEGGIDDLRPRLARCNAELSMLKTLNGIDDGRWTIGSGGEFPRFESVI